MSDNGFEVQVEALQAFLASMSDPITDFGKASQKIPAVTPFGNFAEATQLYTTYSRNTGHLQRSAQTLHSLLGDLSSVAAAVMKAYRDNESEAVCDALALQARSKVQGTIDSYYLGR